ncbi:helix-turn-helix domain-containing protein [uncultured Chryseobacterium sp.]|uniref:helix-turn-helix domain-containing protein n=1 Tax=uncultured Chryseobacterium sp. TaxID=259322 RepID=UPI0025828E5B|nr:helix-turn-helix domain-containing protein [uncultured Chryseobacterium sp.]
MDSKIIQIQDLSVTQLSSIIKNSVREELSNLQPNLNKEIENTNELLTRKQVLDLLKISSVTLWHWQKSGKIITHGISKRRYYKRSEIMECLTKLK